MKRNETEKTAHRAKVVYYLAVDLDREIFIDDKTRKEFTPDEVRKLKDDSLHIEGLEVNTTMMAARLIYHFNYDFQQARDFYKS